MKNFFLLLLFTINANSFDTLTRFADGVKKAVSHGVSKKPLRTMTLDNRMSFAGILAAGKLTSEIEEKCADLEEGSAEIEECREKQQTLDGLKENIKEIEKEQEEVASKPEKKRSKALKRFMQGTAFIATCSAILSIYDLSPRKCESPQDFKLAISAEGWKEEAFFSSSVEKSPVSEFDLSMLFDLERTVVGTMAETFVTLPNGEDWMAELKKHKNETWSETKLIDLTIPGSHDSVSSYVPGRQAVMGTFARTQAVGIREQLKMGVRAFDLRLGYDSEGKITYKKIFR